SGKGRNKARRPPDEREQTSRVVFSNPTIGRGLAACEGGGPPFFASVNTRSTSPHCVSSTTLNSQRIFSNKNAPRAEGARELAPGIKSAWSPQTVFWER